MSWDLEKAKEDYKKEIKKELGKKVSCETCKFTYRCSDNRLYCKVKKTDVFFGGIIAKGCKYFTNKFKEEEKKDV